MGLAGGLRQSSARLHPRWQLADSPASACGVLVAYAILAAVTYVLRVRQVEDDGADWLR